LCCTEDDVHRCGGSVHRGRNSEMLSPNNCSENVVDRLIEYQDPGVGLRLVNSSRIGL